MLSAKLKCSTKIRVLCSIAGSLLILLYFFYIVAFSLWLDFACQGTGFIRTRCHNMPKEAELCSRTMQAGFYATVVEHQEHRNHRFYATIFDPRPLALLRTFDNCSVEQKPTLNWPQVVTAHANARITQTLCTASTPPESVYNEEHNDRAPYAHQS